MHRKTRSDAGDLSSPRSSRAPSFSSDRPSITGSITFQMPASIRPAPAFIAASVASQIVTDHHNAQLRDHLDPDQDAHADPEAALANAIFSEQALNLLNGFLDHLLFAFLSAARSPALTAIRPAITDVLKPRLAREAMATADEELQGLLAGDDEEFPDQDGLAAERWDVEKVWKRTRLRIMVYTRLGELEDEDEERFVQQERGLSMDDDEDEEAGLVSWASAIFLTSVIEYIAEQTLLLCGAAAFARTSAKLKKAAQQSEETEDIQVERIVVEEFDVEKIALNSALGRLWRTWRKRVRSPVTPMIPSRGLRSMSSFSSLSRQRISFDTIEDTIADAEAALPEHKPTETDIAANIPLPMNDNDVNEIEVPGLARQFDDAETSGNENPVARTLRPTSFIVLASAESFRRPSKQRPVSMPALTSLPFTISTAAQAEAELETADDADVNIKPDSKTSIERASGEEPPVEDRNENRDEIRQEQSVADVVDPDTEPDTEMVAFAATTGVGFGMGPVSPDRKAFDNKLDLGLEPPDSPVRSGYEGEPEVLRSKRMSIEKTGRPGLVRTFSSRSARSALIQSPESKSFFNGEHSDDDVGRTEAIGVACTSNVPVRTSPSPSSETRSRESSVSYGKQKKTDDQGFVELTPRYPVVAATAATAAATAFRNSPTPEHRLTPIDTGVQRKEVLQERTVPRRDASQVRVPTLESLQETEPWPNQSSENTSPRARHSSPSGVTPRHSGSLRARDSPVKRKSFEGSPRSRAGGADASVEKSTVKRVSSSSSRSASTSILHTGRDSDTSLGRPRGLSNRMSEEDRQREFDSLVKGDETVKFTLTPQSMRDMDQDSPVIVTKKVENRSPTEAVTVHPRVNADIDSSLVSQSLPVRRASRSKAAASASQPKPVNKSTGLKPLAREPRIQTESMRDFADFIRSTGPAPGEVRPAQPFVSLSGTSTKSSNGSSSTLGGLGRKLSTKQKSSTSLSTSSTNDGPTAKPRIHMEPRSPAGQRSSNDDLIDFIRQGPPSANNGQHRIPRSVAPFRTTVDSDQFDRMLDEHGNVESAYGSQVSTNSRHSVQTANSRTGLLSSPNVQPAYSNTPQKLSGNMSNSSEPQIQRTRRRIKDPYALDMSDDEDDDLLTALPRSSHRKEESLMDFLNAMEPPPSSEPQPLLLNDSTLAAVKARSSNGTNSSPGSTAFSGIGGKNGFGSSKGTSISTITSDAPRARGPKLQARAASSGTGHVGRSATNDLADFLRTSGPPEPVAPPPGAVANRKEPGKSKARFWRKKSHSELS